MTYDGRIQARAPLMILPTSATPKPKRKRAPAKWRPMTDAEQTLAKALDNCTFVPGSNHKRFARNLAGQASAVDPKITDKQREYLHVLVHRYRRQIPTYVLMLRLDDAEQGA